MSTQDTTLVKKSAPHTPGPWVHASSGPVMRSYSQAFAIAEVGELNLVAGVFGDCRGGYDVAAANARLIAAAPDLLAAAKATLEYWRTTGWDECEPDCDCIVDRTRAAIAKAEGRS